MIRKSVSRVDLKAVQTSIEMCVKESFPNAFLLTRSREAAILFD